MTTFGRDHERWGDAVGAYLLRALPDDEITGFEAHLAECPACRRDTDELKVAADALPVSVPLVAPPAALRDRIMAVVNAEAELLAAAGERADRPEAVAAERAPAARRRSAGSRFLAGWLLRPGVALACALVLLAGGGLAGALLGGGGGDGGAGATRSIAADTRAAGADVRLELRGDDARLVARNMPLPPSGRVYQVWLKRPGSDPQPTPVLWEPRADGSAEVAVPGSLDGVEAVLVTDEPRGGSAVPSKTPIITAVPA